MKKSIKILNITLFLLLTYFTCSVNSFVNAEKCDYTISLSNFNSNKDNGSTEVDLTDLVKKCCNRIQPVNNNQFYISKVFNAGEVTNNYINESVAVKNNKVTLKNLNNLKKEYTETLISIGINGSYFCNYTKVKLKMPQVKYSISETVNVSSNYSLKSLIEKSIKEKITDSELSEITNNGLKLILNNSVAFIIGKKDNNDYHISMDPKKLQNVTNAKNTITVNFIHKGKKITLNINFIYNETVINKTISQSEILKSHPRISLAEEVAKKLGNKVSTNDIKIGTVDYTSNLINVNMSTYKISFNNDIISKSKIDTKTSISFRYTYNNTAMYGEYNITIKADSNNSNNDQTEDTSDSTDNQIGDSSNNDSGTTTPKEEKACYYYPNTNVYYWATNSEASAKSQGMTYNKTSKSQSECHVTNATKKDNEEAEDIANTVDSTIPSGTTSVTELGENACKSYIISRIRGYNSSSTNIPTYNDSYFRNAVGLPGTSYQYYYVYEAKYNCEGYDKNTSVTAFCVDPGARGAENTGTKYNVGKTINKDSALGKGIYHLYTYWYLDHSDEIKSTYSGSSPNGAEDLVDYVVSNVARQLINKYGSTEGVAFTNPLKNGYGTKSQLTQEYNAYKSKTVGVDALSSLKSKEILTKVWLDTDEYASGKKQEKSNQTEVKFGINLDSSSTKNNKKGFDAEFTVTLQTADKDILKAITENYEITATVVENNTTKDITSAITSTIDESGWQSTDNGTSMTAKFKVSAEDIYSYVSEDNISNVKINFKIHYVDKRSINNIMYLTPVGGKYQKFISFLNGVIDTERSVSIEMDKENTSSCRPTFAMPCVDKETVVYLIEGTQSGTLYNTVMNGIKSAGDVKNIISNAYNMVKTLLDNGLSGLGDSELKLISSFIYNLADKVNISSNIKTELSFLQALGNNGNNTAKTLYNAISNMSFNKDSSQNYIQLQSLFTNSLLNVLNNGYEKVYKEWQEIIINAEEAVSRNQLSKSTYELLDNIQNLIASSKNYNGLSSILKGVQTLTDKYLKDLPNVSSIKELAVSFGSAISGTIQSASGLQNIYQQLSTTWNQIFNIDSLSDINISGIYNSLTSAFTVDWEKCIIGEDGKEAVDPAGNSYTVQSQNMYCKVVCKEDYAIKMPGNLGSVYAGQNLSTNVDNKYHATIGMAGQRTCVSTKIDNDAYVNDAAAVKDNILNAYNDFQKNYAHYKELKNQYSQFQNKEKAAYNDGKLISIDVSLDSVKTDFGNVISTTMSTFLSNLIDPKTEEERDILDTLKKEVANGLEGDNSIVMKLIGTFMHTGSIGSSDISTILTSTIGKKGEELVSGFEERFEKAFESTAKTLQDQLETIAKKYAADGVLSTASTGGKMAISAACKILTKVPVVNSVALPVCNGVAGVTTGISSALTSISNSTINSLKIFAIHDFSSISLDGSYNKFKYNTTATDSVSKLKASITEQSELVNEGNLTFNKDRYELWVMDAGSYNMSTTYFGLTLNLTMLKKAFNSFSNLGNADYGVISDTLEYISKAAEKVGNMNSYSEIKSSQGTIRAIKDSGILDNVISTIGNLTTAIGDVSSALGNAQSDITKYVDTALDGIYYLLGAFNPYYYQVALIREQMQNAKTQYDAYREQLENLAGNMNQCTMFDNEYEFNPDLVFTYGYPNNGILDYIVDKKNSTAASIRLQAINPQESSKTVTYYCQDDVPINNIQDISTIISGKCTTSDSMFGGIIASVFGSDSQMTNILNKFKENSDGLRKLLNNDKVKEYINSSGLGSQLNNFLCGNKSLLGDSLCNIIGNDTEEDNALVTNVPGDIVYTLRDTKLSSSSWSNIKSIFNGGIYEIDKNITSALKYTTTGDNQISYRNAKRVVSVSRYGNPGVSISGLSFTSLLSNIATWISSEAGGQTSDTLTKINDTVMNITGQGAQKFIYYQSSQQYWTSSNKGIYETAPTSSDSILADAGDKALTNDRITTADGSTKEANGYIYPIALSTAAGNYSYQIKINNVGQYYNNTLGLGRIIDNNGYVSGLLANQYVCKYEVKSEPDTPNASCEEILESNDCKDENGYFKDLYKDQKNYTNTNGIDYESKWNACITKLLAENDSCCYLVDSNNVPNASQDRYNSMCNSKCQGIKLYGSDSAIKDTTSSNSALISKNGNLQFYTKVVSNYDYFPNGEGSKGYNWSGYTSGYENLDENGLPQPQKISDLQKKWEEVGDNTYADDNTYLDYSITLNSACMAKIKEYNDQQELNDLGFGDYTLGSISKESRDYQSKFLKDLEENSEYASCQKAITNQLQK